jgi:hypothetical protein
LRDLDIDIRHRAFDHGAVTDELLPHLEAIRLHPVEASRHRLKLVLHFGELLGELPAHLAQDCQDKIVRLAHALVSTAGTKQEPVADETKREQISGASP